MILEDRLKIAIGKQKADVFLRTEFAGMGSGAQLGRALRKLVDEGIIVKLGVGVYAKAKRSVLSGKPIPMQPIEVLAVEALNKLGVQTYPSARAAAYNDSDTTQAPAGTVINTGRRRIARKLGFGNTQIQYENHYWCAARPDRCAADG